MNKVTFIFVLFCMASMNAISSNIYITSLPIMMSYLHVTPSGIKLTFTVFFIGISIPQLIYGPLADIVGRKKILMVGFIILIIGNFIGFFAQNFFYFLLGRFIQGCGVSAMTSSYRTILSDHYKGKELSQIMSFIGMGVAMFPAIVPMLGAYVQYILSWRYDFVLMATYGIVLAVMAYTLIEETLPPTTRRRKNLKEVVYFYLKNIHNLRFIAYVSISSFNLSSMYVFYTITSISLQKIQHWTHFEYGYVTILVAMGLFTGRIANIYLLKYFSGSTIIVLGSFLAFSSGLLMGVFNYFHVYVGLVLLLPFFFYAFSGGIMLSNTFVGATFRHLHTKGAINSLYGFTQMMIVSVLLWISSILHVDNIIDMVIWLSVLSLISIFLSWFLIVKKV